MGLCQTMSWLAWLGLVGISEAIPNKLRPWDVHSGLPGDSTSVYTRRTVSPLGNGTCPIPFDIPVRALRPSPFLSLSADEVASISAWLHDPARGLNLTAASSETLAQTDNYIWIIEALYPNKTGILNYLDNNGSFPDRYARVAINEGGKNIPDVSEYYVGIPFLISSVQYSNIAIQVGPLPISSKTIIQNLDYIYSRAARFPFNGRIADGPRGKAIDTIVASTMSSIADITLNLTGLVYYGASDERSNSEYFIQNPTSLDGTKASFWAPWRRAGLASYDQPSDLYVNFDVSGSDASTYKMQMIVYDLIVYTTIKDFRDAFEAGKINKTPNPSSDTAFLRKNRKGPVREMENRFAPTILPLGGKRYKVDEESRYIEYMGWKFYTAFTRDVGIKFFDVKYKDERVLYELSLQGRWTHSTLISPANKSSDAVAQYAGNNPFQAGTAYNDRFYGIGGQTARLVPGYDCPYHATYLNGTFTDGESLVNTKNAICIFETDLGHPITRHRDGTYLQSTKGSALVVRVIATVGNYDYLWDYTFGIDGSIGIDARASGYVQANYYRPDDEAKWGPRMQETIAGTLHTHVMNFKADFDLIDSKNTFLKTDIIVENITQRMLSTFFQFLSAIC